MYVDISTITRNGKRYTRYLLRESYRDQGQVKHRTLANLSPCSLEAIEAIRWALRHKHAFPAVDAAPDHLVLRQGLSVGALWLVYPVAQQVGIVRALGTTRAGQLALWQVLARVIDQGSRLSAVRLAGMHAVCDVLGLGKFNEEDRYENLDWLCDQQTTIEDRLAKRRLQGRSPGLFLYDVTSSYCEGEHNALAALGYNRDGKKGKRQIVIGLLCDEEGKPWSIEVLPGNTQDPQTVAAQMRKVTERCGGGRVVFVGDRGMLKSPQIEALVKQGLHYIPALTKPQIASLLKNEVLHIGLFNDAVTEVTTSEGVRYILRRNPMRAQEMQPSRAEQYQTLQKAVEKHNRYRTDHPRAKVDVALRHLTKQGTKLQMASWVSVAATGRILSLSLDRAALQKATQLDGCYVIQTDLRQELMRKEIIHARYKDLALVAWAFRSCKTTHLAMRPIHVHWEKRTRGQALVVMLAYHIITELRARWQPLHITVEEGITELSHLCSTEVQIQDQRPYQTMPAPRDLSTQLLEAAQVRLPRRLPSTGIVVATKKLRQKKRKSLKTL
jgi:hypothetical protein